jgi:hypothetical protein
MSAEPTKDDDGMPLPPGKTCKDCVHFSRCEWLISCEPGNETCDWSPSRFRPRKPLEVRR